MIKHPGTFDETWPAGFDGVFHWDFLKPAFAPTKIEPMDLDAIVERNGKFLVFETKGNGVPIPQGQLITLEQLTGTGLFTVIVLRGKTAVSIAGWDVWFRGSNGVVKRHIEGGSEDLVKFVRRWFLKANRPY